MSTAPVTLQQLSDEIGADYLLDILDTFGFQSKDNYEQDDRDLAEIRAFRAHMKAINSKSVSNAFASYGEPQSAQAPQQSKTAKKASKGQAIAKSAEQREQAKGALAVGKQKALESNLKGRINEGVQMADHGAAVMVESMLKRSSANYEAIASSIDKSNQRVIDMGEDVFASIDVDAEIAQAGADFLLEGSGGQMALPGAFSL